MASNVNIITPRPRVGNSQTLKNVESLSRLLDSRFTIPGTNIRFGLDPVMSMFPVVGDLITYVISGMLIYTMYNHGASRKVVLKMLANSTLDALIGVVPVVGTVFDIFYRSNDRNVKLLKEHYFEGKHQGSGNGIILIVTLFAVLIIAAAIYGISKLVGYLS